MSIKLPKILKIPKPINKERTVVTMVLECSLSHNRMTDCALNVKSGTSAGKESTKAMVIAPLMMPTTKAATMANL